MAAAIFFLITPRPPTSTLFPYTTLFRSYRHARTGPEVRASDGLEHDFARPARRVDGWGRSYHGRPCRPAIGVDDLGGGTYAKPDGGALRYVDGHAQRSQRGDAEQGIALRHEAPRAHRASGDGAGEGRQDPRQPVIALRLPPREIGTPEVELGLFRVGR